MLPSLDWQIEETTPDCWLPQVSVQFIPPSTDFRIPLVAPPAYKILGSSWSTTIARNSPEI